MNGLRRAFKYRIYPTKSQAARLDRWLEVCRELYNAALEERIAAWRSGVTIRYADQSAQLPEIKKLRSDLADVTAQVLQQTLRRLDFAFKRFFERVQREAEKVGHPRFKSKTRYGSLTWPSNENFRIVGRKRISLGTKFGQVRIKLHRPLEGTPKTCTVCRDGSGHWHAVINCENVPKKPYLEAKGEIGIDLGLETFAAFSTGEKIPNPRWNKEFEKRISDAHKSVSRKKRGSKRRLKAWKAFSRLHAKAREKRRDFQHKLARRIVIENSFIALENLIPSKMSEKQRKSVRRSIDNVGWWTFMKILSVKAEEAGRTVVKVLPFGTSSTCSACGDFRKKNLSERMHSCPCGLVLDRDVNAAINILRLGRSLRGSSPAKPPDGGVVTR